MCVYVYVHILSVLLFQFCDTYLEVPLISMNMYHLDLSPESNNMIILLF